MKMQQMSLLGIGLGVIAALGAMPSQAEPLKTLPAASSEILLGDGIQKESGWYGSINPSVVFGHSLEGKSEAFIVKESDFSSSPRPACFYICTLQFPPPPIPNIGDEVQPFDISIDNGVGFGISGSAGYRVSPALRFDLELGFNRNNVNSVSIENILVRQAPTTSSLPIPPSLGTPPFETSLVDYEADLDGKVDTWTLMANGYYDINTNSNFKPYLGGGVGIAKRSATGIKTDFPDLYTSYSQFSLSSGLEKEIDLDDSSVSFIFQVKAGTAYQIGDRGSISLGYRLQGLPGQKFEADGIDFDSQTVLTHAVEFGGQYQF